MKKILSLTVLVCLLAGILSVPVSADAALLQAGERLLNPVYYMDFSPDTDGKFYDSPAGTAGRVEIALTDYPSGITLMTGDTENYGGKIISTSNSGRMRFASGTADKYDAFSAYGASGEANDYCIKAVDASTTEGTPYIDIYFPQCYGATTDTCTNKYRFEMDWKWQGYNSTTKEKIDLTSPTGTNLMRFYIDEKKLNLKSKANTDQTDDAVRGKNALYFDCSDFGLTSSNQATEQEADLTTVTTSASKIPNSESGKWQHITVDFDFAAGTIYAHIKGETVTTEISTAITGGIDSFSKGISYIRIMNSTKDDWRINYYDNIKFTPIVEDNISITSNGITEDENGTTATASATVTANVATGYSDKLVLYAAYYDGDSLEKIVVSSEVAPTVGENTPINVSLGGLPTVSAKDTKVKFFLWKGDMTPIDQEIITSWGNTVTE